MPLVKFHNVGRAGINRDLPADELPPEVWSNANNVLFSDGKIKKSKGHQAVFDPPSIVPYAVFPAPYTTTLYWVYLGLAAAYNVQGSTHTVMTRASGAYNASATIPWTGGVGGGVFCCNNGVDVPQMWLPAGAPNLLQDLTAWPAGYTARILRPFSNYWVAFDVTKSGTRYPYLTLWSHAAEPGTVPDSWDVADATRDAGDSPKLADTSGYILDALPLGDTLVIYKEDATYTMSWIGGNDIFDIDRAFEQVGMLTHRCVAALPKGDSHFVVGSDDLLLHNLNQVRAIGSRRIKTTLYNEIDLDNLVNCHVVPNYPLNEVLFFYSSNAAPAFCDRVCRWNYADDTLTLRDAPGVYHSNFGRVDVTLDEVIDSDSGIIDSDSSIIDDRAFQGLKREVLMAGTVDTKLFLMDTSNQFNGSNMTAYVERTGLAIAGTDREGNPKVDFESYKLFKRVWIRATGDPFDVYLGAQELKGGAVTWQTKQTFTPGSDQYADFYGSGRALAIKFESTGNVAWEIEGFDVEVELLGLY